MDFSNVEEAKYACNSCFSFLNPGTQALVTLCGHCFCMGCAEKISATGDAKCAACKALLTSENVGVVNVQQCDDGLEQVMVGMSVDKILQVTETIFKWHELQMDIADQVNVRLLKRKLGQITSQSKDKLKQVKSAYDKAVAKTKDAIVKKTKIDEDIVELREKAAEQSRACRRLEAEVQKLRHERDVKLQQRGRSRGRPEPSPIASALAPRAPSLGDHRPGALALAHTAVPQRPAGNSTQQLLAAAKQRRASSAGTAPPPAGVQERAFSPRSGLSNLSKDSRGSLWRLLSRSRDRASLDRLPV